MLVRRKCLKRYRRIKTSRFGGEQRTTIVPRRSVDAPSGRPNVEHGNVKMLWRSPKCSKMENRNAALAAFHNEIFS